VTARIKFLRVSPFKVRRYTQLIEGQDIARARALLRFQPSPTCQDLLKLLNAAVANAENNFEMDPELMVVSRVQVDGGPSYRRIKPRARGRAYRIVKRTSHVQIELDLRPELRIATRGGAAREEAAEGRGAAKAQKPKTTKTEEPEGPSRAMRRAQKGERRKSAVPRGKREKKPAATPTGRRATTVPRMREKGGE